MPKKAGGGGATGEAAAEDVAPVGKVLMQGEMEKCSDGKRAKSVGNLKGTWNARYVVMTRAGVWWYKTKEDYDGGSKAQGCVLELPSAEINYDQTFQWLQFITPDRVLSIRPVDRYDDLREWISALGNKQNTNSGKREKKAGKKKAPETWEDLVAHEFGMVTSDLGCSFHGIVEATGGLNEDDMIGYLAKGDALKLVNWPDKTVTMDKYGYPNVCVEVTHSAEGGYKGKKGYCELKACTF